MVKPTTRHRHPCQEKPREGERGEKQKKRGTRSTGHRHDAGAKPCSWPPSSAAGARRPPPAARRSVQLQVLLLVTRTPPPQTPPPGLNVPAALAEPVLAQTVAGTRPSAPLATAVHPPGPTPPPQRPTIWPGRSARAADGHPSVARPVWAPPVFSAAGRTRRTLPRRTRLRSCETWQAEGWVAAPSRCPLTERVSQIGPIRRVFPEALEDAQCRRPPSRVQGIYLFW